MAQRFVDSPGGTSINAANLNSLDRGGNVYPNAGGGLFVDISGLTFSRASQAGLVTYAGESALAVTDNSTNYIYLDNSGTRHINTSGFPASFTVAPYIPLATVVTSGGAITSVNDKRLSAYLP